MRKFKLIETYPESPELGSIYGEIQRRCGTGSGRMYKNLSTNGCCLDARVIESDSRYWEEVIRKEYEILSLSYGNDIYIKTGNKVKSYPFKDLYNEFKVPNKDGLITDREIKGNTKFDVKIYSIKRLSDGEVFTVDDKIGHNGSKPSFYTVIKGFSIENEYCFVTCEDSTKISFPIVNKYIEPLFTIEDSVDIFEGNTYWCVNTAPHLWSLFEQTSKERTKLNKTVKAFSTKEGAEEYILFNKPCLSIMDIDKTYTDIFIISGNRDHGSHKYIEKIKKLAKSKLK